MPRKNVLSDNPPAKAKRVVAMNQRAKKNKALDQRRLREKIAAGNHHAHILKTLAELHEMNEEVKDMKVLDKEEQAAYMVRLGALKTKMDAQFKLLNKYLPDLRSIEFREGEEGNPFASAAKAWAEALNSGITPRVGDS